MEQLQNAREYSVEARVTPNGPLVGRSIAEVGLRSMRFAYVLEISRGERLLTAVGPDEVLQPNDRVTFVGVVDAVNELRRIPGLLVAEDQTFQLNLRHAQRCLVELVLSPASALVGQTVRESGFRSTYNAAIISISREGARLEGKLGDVRLRAGDTLLVETDQAFVERQKYNREFLLVSSLQDSAPPDFARAPVAFLILLAMLVVATFEWVPLFQASFIAAGLMVATGCVTLNVARRSIEYPVLAGIAASFALGFALAESGAADLLAGWIGGIARGDPFWALVVLYIATVDHHRADHQQRRGRADVPDRHGRGAGRQRELPAVRGGDHGRRVRRLHHADRLPDQPDGVRARRLPLERLHPLRHAAQHHRGDCDGADRAAGLAVLGSG